MGSHPKRPGHRWLLFLPCLVPAACTTLRPEDAPAVAPAAASTAAADFPGAAGILSGFELGGERTLRDGDQLLFGVAAHQGERTQRYLLRIRVARRLPGTDVVGAKISGRDPDKLPIPPRLTRRLDLDLTLFSAAGQELARSRITEQPDMFFETSFLPGIHAFGTADSRPADLASMQLFEISKMLQQDPILKRLLGEVASIPLDLRLLWRREISMHSYFGKASPVVPEPGPLAAGARYELPFDLFLNDSLLVRLAANVMAPKGPMAAAAGIVRLRAQQADDPSHALTLELLAARRGAQTEFVQHGVVTDVGWGDEGVGLAFSPDGRFVAVPGEHGVVLLRDLQREDPTVPVRLRGAREAVGDLAFVDAHTLLVGRSCGVEVFSVGEGNGPELQPSGWLPSPWPVVAIEPAGERVVFVGGRGTAVQRWTLDEAGQEALVETVQETVLLHGTTEAGVRVSVPATTSLGWLLADGPERCVVRSLGKEDTHLQRTGDGVWQKTRRARPAHEFARLDRRLDAPPAGTVYDEVAKGTVISRPRSEDGHGGSGTHFSVSDAETTRVLGSSFCSAKDACHGFDPSGRFFAFVGPGYRMLVDRWRAPVAASGMR